MNTKVAVVGSGYWGKNLVRVFYELGVLHLVCDVRQEVLSEIEAGYAVPTTGRLDRILDDPEIDAVVISAPAAEHFKLAHRCLRADKDVFVEKPLALRAREGAELVELANQRGRILMVGHILQYHPAILELKHRICSGDLGNIQYLYSSRLNLGKLRNEENILWSFAPHDISAILYLLGERPSRIASQGGNYLNHNIDTTLTTCDFPSGVKAHIFVSWLHPFKEQRLAIVGGRKMAVFDDLEPERKLVLYPHRIEWRERIPIAEKHDGEVVFLPKAEPLRLECEHFLECVTTRKQPRTGGENALEVLRVLEACEESVKANGKAIEICKADSDYFAHSSAFVDLPCEIGEGTRIWHFAHLMAGSKVGANCNLGQNVVISPGVIVGNNVKIQNNVSVYTGVILEDDVFCGPSMVFTNVLNPRSHVLRKHEFKRTLVRQGASIGANATIVCGVTLGRYCFIGAGSLVRRDVPDYAVVAGVPARQIGWICYCGVRLQDTASPACAACSRRYSIVDGVCRELEDRLHIVPVTTVASESSISAKIPA